MNPSHTDPLISTGILVLLDYLLSSPISTVLCSILPMDDGRYPDATEMVVVVIGTDDGHVLFMHSIGECLFELNLNSGPVQYVSVTFPRDTPGLSILCSSVIFVLNLEDIRKVLLKSAFELSKVDVHECETANVNDKMGIRFRKLFIPHGESLSQFSCSTTKLPYLFDHMVGKSIQFPEERSDASWHLLPVQTVWTVAGRKPLISFNFLEEKAPAATLTSLLYVEAKRAILGSSSYHKNTLVVEFSDHNGQSVTPYASCTHASSSKLTLVHGLADQRRHVLDSSLVVSSDGYWLAMTDSLGRVLLVNEATRRVARMWKGYRDAELAFVDTSETVPRSGVGPTKTGVPDYPRSTRCLFIHAPHRRILEVWRLIHGPRLATWNVDEPVRLVQIQASWLSRASSTIETSSLKSQAVLVDGNGVGYTLDVNPDLCLAGTDDEASLGYHEFQVMQDCFACLERIHWDDPTSVCSQLSGLFAKFKTPSWFERALLHTVHHLSHKPYLLIELFKDCIQLLECSTNSSLDRAEGKLLEVHRLHAICMKLHALATLYLHFCSLIKDCIEHSLVSNISPSIETWDEELENVSDLLNWDLEDADRCLKLYTFAGSILRPSSHLQLTRPMELHTFIDCFTYRTDLSISRTNLNNSTVRPESRWPPVLIELRADDPSNQLAKIGSLVFSPYVLGHQLFADLKKQLEMDVLSPELLLRALTGFLLYWETYQALPTLIRRLHRIYTYLFGCFISTSWSAKSYVDPQNSSFLQLERLLSQLYSYCLDGAHFSSTYLVSLIIRCVVYTMWQSLEHGTDLVLALWSGSQENLSSSGDSIRGLSMTFREAARPSTPSVTEQIDSCNTWHSSTLQSHTTPLQSTPVSSTSLNKLIDQWHDTCTRLEDLLGLGLLVQVRASEAFSNGSVESLARNVFPITLRRVLCFGRACLTELFASWLVHWQVEPDQLITLYQSLCTLPKSDNTTCRSKQTLVAEQPEASTELVSVSSVGLRQALFPLVYRRLPFTLELDTVIASVCWMHYQRWLSDPEAIRHFQKCIEYLRRLSSAGAMISQGLATIMWQGRLRFWYGQCVNAVCGSNAELPANRLGNEQLKYISILLMNFMSVYASACEKADVVPVFSVEREWTATITTNQQSRSTNDELSDMQMELDLKKDRATAINPSRTLISEAAVNQLAPDRRSVLSWEQVMIVVAALHAFGRPVMIQKREKSSLGPKSRYEPMNFFVPEDSDAITKSFSPNWISASLNQQVSTSLDSRRRFFLAWLIERAVLTYRTTSASDLMRFWHSSSLGSWRAYEPLDVYKLFTSAAVTLCRHWGYPKDVAVSQHVLSLFEATLDDQAELYLSQIQNLTNLATGLLVIVGRRVAWLCFDHKSPNQLRWRSCIPFELESWLRGLLPDPSDEFSLEVSCDRNLSYMDPMHLAHLIEFVLQNIPAYASQNATAESLRDAINSMID
ncbi:hypothetical protein EG68_05453 [Paragonimus skrjabini miyazakii]|uniref:Rab3 GTPase-activating protein non-catalytic subunit n=1 Tax=Paragonimus skrjabini miyazakii TaxID=59628 RepID=A0A8S9YIB6_9TREM|nr:hypothetical protein EG68_05453 [Paragonimus skrjabini miyazakii]